MENDLTIQPEPSSEDAHDRAFPAITWRRELQRWLATLNPGRTPHEYEKAVRYFFETPGVPETLRDLTFDLLLAYRGALALRATPHHQQPRARPAQAPSPLIADTEQSSRLVGETHLLSAQDGDREEDEPREHANAPTSHTPRDTNGPLAPATVNIRLTALRQFLCWCALNGVLPQLTAERIRGALRRLSIERRRPYQVLAEAEWEGFLAAALTAEGVQTRDRDEAVHDRTNEDDAPVRRGGPWGRTRAERAASQCPSAAPQSLRATGGNEKADGTHGRLTGRHTRQRDHALIALALGAGLRAIELTSLDVGDLKRERHAGQEEWWLVLPDEKTKGQHGGRTLPLATSLVETLLAYIQATGRRWESASDRATPLFLSTHGQSGSGARETLSATSRQRRLSPSHVRLIVDRVERQWRQSLERERGEDVLAGEGRAISPHALRHSTAVALLEGNEAQGRPPASVEHVRGWLGHFDIRTTQGYLAHLDARRHRRPFTLTPTSARPSDPPSASQSDSPPGVESSE